MSLFYEGNCVSSRKQTSWGHVFSASAAAFDDSMKLLIRRHCWRSQTSSRGRFDLGTYLCRWSTTFSSTCQEELTNERLICCFRWRSFHASLISARSLSLGGTSSSEVTSWTTASKSGSLSNCVFLLLLNISSREQCWSVHSPSFQVWLISISKENKLMIIYIYRQLGCLAYSLRFWFLAKN